MCSFCVCAVLCLGRGLATSWSPVQGVLTIVNRSGNWKAAGAHTGCRVIGKISSLFWLSKIRILDTPVKCKWAWDRRWWLKLEEFVVMAAVKFISGLSPHSCWVHSKSHHHEGETLLMQHVYLYVLSNSRPRFFHVTWTRPGNGWHYGSDKNNES
jgi:hypothetical protein